MFVLEQYEAVIRDTQHNLDVLDLCSRYGKTDYDRACLEQYRPYILDDEHASQGVRGTSTGVYVKRPYYLRGGIKRIAAIRCLKKSARSCFGRAMKRASFWKC